MLFHLTSVVHEETIGNTYIQYRKLYIPGRKVILYVKRV